MGRSPLLVTFPCSRQTREDFLSVGRVQSPTLSLIVDKKRKGRFLSPLLYWEIHSELENEKEKLFCPALNSPLP